MDTLRKKLLIGTPLILLIASILLFIVFLFINNFHNKKIYWVNHTHDVIIQANNLSTRLLKLETGQRGYLLTQNLEYLQPYLKSKEYIEVIYTDLLKLTSDNIKQQKRLEKLKFLIDNKTIELERTITLTKNSKYKEALSIVNEDYGKEYMEIISNILKELIKEEERLLVIRKNDYENLIQYGFIFNILIVIAVMVFIFKYFNIFKNQTLLKEAHEEIKKQNKELEINSENLLKINRELEESEYEIDLLNQNLNQKVQEQVAEIIQKEKIIYEQTKLASMGEMIGNIAHQWRQPLSIISSAATGMLMQKEYGVLDDKIFEYNCTQINDNVQYLSHTVDDFRNFIKGDSKAIKFNLKDTIDRFHTLINSVIAKNNINLIIDVSEKIELIGYPNELIQCFMNFFNNAKDAMIENKIKKRKRYIFISVQKKNKKIKIIFKDSAGGIPKKILHRVFEAYFTTKQQSHGTGIGLHMTHKLVVEKMEGNISVSNEKFIYKDTKFVGAVFTIELPL